MLSFSNDQEFLNLIMTTELREGQFSENELLYMMKRFREEVRKYESRKTSLSNDLFNQQKQNESLEKEIEKLKQEKHFIECKNKVLLNKFKNGLSFWERLTGKVKY